MPQYQNERRAYVPLVGDEVVIEGRFIGKLLVEKVDPVRRTAILRNARDNTLITDVTWETILPLKYLSGIAGAIDAIEKGEW
jgi:hypothetical protein